MLVAVKILVNVLLITGITELTKRSVIAAALIGALPIVTVLAMIWMHVEGQDGRKIADYSMATFWLVLPTLPMFVIYPWFFSRGMSFWPALSISIVIMLVFYLVLAFFLPAPDAVASDAMQQGD